MQSYVTFEYISNLNDLFFPAHNHNQRIYIPVSLRLLNPEASGGKYWAQDWYCPFQSDGDFGGKEQSPCFAGRQQHGATIHCQLIGMYCKEMLQWLSNFFFNWEKFQESCLAVGGSQFHGSLPAHWHVPPIFCLIVLLEFIVFLWFVGSQQSGF